MGRVVDEPDATYKLILIFKAQLLKIL